MSSMATDLTVVGHVGKLGDVKTWDDGNQSQSFSVAHSEKVGDKEYTTWFEVQLTKDQISSKLPQYLTKGKLVAVTGKVSARAYTQNNEPKAQLVLRFPRIKLMGGGEQPNGHAAPAATTADAPEMNGEEIPF